MRFSNESAGLHGWLRAASRALMFIGLMAAFRLTLFAAGTAADAQLAEYFRMQTEQLSERCLNEEMLSGWKANRAEYRRQLKEMLGLLPEPPRAALNATITGTLDHDEFTVEKLHFQALPGLYVTANLYVPKGVSRPMPAVLYECGHWRLVTNGVSYGNKAVYQIDGAWYARNGYVCLVLDTLLAGEIQGIHTGTRDHGLWWWNSRGYTPAGVEAWFGIRALDYLCARPEVDTNRIGITGHSGGGAYSWMVTALDDRVAVAAPLGGMADIETHIGAGVIDSHCDCNFFINTFRWDFPQVAALAAPRPLLMGGTDQDRIFPLATTLRIHEKVRRVYELYGARDGLGLVIAPGPHDETPELRLAVMRWFNKHLKGVDTPVRHVAERLFAPQDLKVFNTLPGDAINTNIAETFVPPFEKQPSSIDELRTVLREKVFAGWPDDDLPLNVQRVRSVERDGVAFSAWDFESQPGVRLRLYVHARSGAKPQRAKVTVLDQAEWRDWVNRMRARFETELRDEVAALGPDAPAAGDGSPAEPDEATALVFFAPRGIGLTRWSGDQRAFTRIRRRFMLLGQTVDGMRVWDIHRALQAVRETGVGEFSDIELSANGDMTMNALHARLFQEPTPKLVQGNFEVSGFQRPAYLNVLRIEGAGEADLRLR